MVAATPRLSATRIMSAMSGRQNPRRTTLHVFGAAAARREPPCVRPARARCRARWHAATQARGACPAGADRGAHGATRPEGAWRTDLDVACPLLALHRAGFVRPGRRRCLGQREPSSLSKVQSRSAGNRKAKGFQKSATAQEWSWHTLAESKSAQPTRAVL